MTIKGSDIPESLVVPKCQALLKSVQKKKKKIDLASTGDSKTNLLLDLLKCQVKKDKEISCTDQLKEYNKCHSSFMGTGSYQGRQHCQEEMQTLYYCVFPPTPP